MPLHRRLLHHFPDTATLVGTEPQQDASNISENDQCVTIPLRLLYQLSSAILTSFDSLLAKLDKSILPLYTSTQILTKRENSASCRPPCRVPNDDEMNYQISKVLR
jgi:hypothetical protein